jgi:hypothetical protein
MASCCSCRVPANSFAYVLDGPYNYPGPDVTVKLIATVPPSSSRDQASTQCSASTTPTTDLGVPLGYATGMRAWTLSLSDLNYALYEKDSFSPSPLGAVELNKLVTQCAVATQCFCLPGALPSLGTSSVSPLRHRNPFGIK